MSESTVNGARPRGVKILRRTELTGQICVVLGTRPSFIKFGPVVAELARRGAPYFVIHSGQHYSYLMEGQIVRDVGLPPPAHVLSSVRRSKLHGEQTAAMLRGIERILLVERPSVVLVGGDANTNLAGALAARKLNLVVGHMESGLRSRDWQMPEEHNRVIIDHISEYLFAPTSTAAENLHRENVSGTVVVTGNPIVDAVEAALPRAMLLSDVLRRLDLRPGGYIILTLHREENLDAADSLDWATSIIGGIVAISNQPVIFPVHPRTERRLKQTKDWRALKTIRGLRMIEPLGYLDFLRLLADASLVVTDSGGIQEEACILKIPCVTLRSTTERPETITVGANVIAGHETASALTAVQHMLGVARNWQQPFGDGHAAVRIADEAIRAAAVSSA